MKIHGAGWPRGITEWVEDRTLHLSIPFTWLLPEARQKASQTSLLWDRVVAGGPAMALIPGYLADIPAVTEGHSSNGVLQRINPNATRTTLGCPNRCPFCAVPQLEGAFRELDDWPDLPVLIDNNLLAASQPHLDRVFDRLEAWGWADFNQGLDARLVTDYHAERLARIEKPIVRLALDHSAYQDQWERAFDMLRGHGIRKESIRSFALIAFNSGPDEAWERCRWIESHGVKALPMWFHELDTLRHNTVTVAQKELGWTDHDRRRIMQWFYQHKKAVNYEGVSDLPGSRS